MGQRLQEDPYDTQNTGVGLRIGEVQKYLLEVCFYLILNRSSPVRNTEYGH